MSETPKNTFSADPIPMKRFRRRIRLVRAWRLGAMCGIAGAAAAAVMALLDLFSIVYFEPWMLAAFTGLGVLVGVSRALTEALPDSVVARSVDRRGHLADRLTTVSEAGGGAPAWSEAVRIDAAAQAGELRPAAVYPVRFGRWQGAFVCIALAAAIIYFAGNSPWFRSEQQRKDAAALQIAATQVERIARPALEAADTRDAAPEDKDLARELKKFAQDLQKGRMTKAEAMVRANQLADAARNIEQHRTQTIAQSIQQSQTAQQALQQMAGMDSRQLQSMTPEEQREAMGRQANQLSTQQQSAQQQVNAIQKALQSGKSLDGKSALSQKERAALEKQLEQLAKLMSKIKLSQQALDFLQKLAQQPDYQKAMDALEKLAENQMAQENGQPPTMTPEQLEQAAKALEEEAKALEKMAQEHGSDADIKALAEQMLEAAKAARMCKNPGIGPGLMAAFGMSMPGMPMRGPGAPTEDTWTGGIKGPPPMSDKSSVPNSKFTDKVVAAQIGSKGDQTYVEVTGPSTPTGKTSVPYQSVLPKYERTAETAINRGDIPPSERVKVRSYFDSLRQR